MRTSRSSGTRIRDRSVPAETSRPTGSRRPARPWRRAGLFTTNSLRQPKSLPALKRITASGAIADAWTDLPWLQEGAAVRVSIFSFDDGSESQRAVHHLEAEGTPQEQVRTVPTALIHADLTTGLDLGTAQALSENAGRSFQGVKLVGPFDIPADAVRTLIGQLNVAS